MRAGKVQPSVVMERVYLPLALGISVRAKVDHKLGYDKIEIEKENRRKESKCLKMWAVHIWATQVGLALAERINRPILLGKKQIGIVGKVRRKDVKTRPSRSSLLKTI